MKYWEMAVLRCINSLGRAAYLQEIYNKLHDFINFTERHLRVTKWGDKTCVSIYSQIVRSYISNMCQSGLLRRTSRGCYKIIEYKINEGQG